PMAMIQPAEPQLPSDPLPTLIHAYARAGHVAGVADELANGVDIEVRDAVRGRTALMYAVASPRAGLDLVRLLIARGANVNAREQEWDRTVLSLAVGAGHLEKILALLD